MVLSEDQLSAPVPSPSLSQVRGDAAASGAPGSGSHPPGLCCPAPSSSGHLESVMFSASPPALPHPLPGKTWASLGAEQNVWLWAQIPFGNLRDGPKEPFHLKARVTLRRCLVWPVLCRDGEIEGLLRVTGQGRSRRGAGQPESSPG